jgi:hypothetical protein
MCNLSGEPSFALFPALDRTPKEAYNNELLVPALKHGGGSVMIWAAISWYSVGPTITGRITASNYVDSLGNQEHPMVQILFPNNDTIFPNDFSAILTARCVQSWFEEHENSLQHLCPAQSRDLNITEQLWSVLDSREISRFPPPSFFKQLDVLHGKRHNITLETVQNLRESIPRRMQAVSQANGGPTPYQ